MLQPLVIADDLTGAAECAVAFLPRNVRISNDGESTKSRESRVDAGDESVLVVDTDSRYVEPDEAARRCRAALFARASGTVLKKIDSTLRGPLAAELAELRAGGAAVITAPALPAAGRTVVDGVVRVDDVALPHTAAWASEPGPAPASVAEALHPLPTGAVGLDVIRTGVAVLAERLAEVLAAGAVAVCDAETDDDLDEIVRAGRTLARSAGSPSAQVRWAGSAGLAHALARAEPPAARPGAQPWVPRSAAPALFVLGTTAPATSRQVSRLAELVDEVVGLEVSDVLGAAGERAASLVSQRTDRRSGVVFLAQGDDGVPARRSPEIARALARVVAPAARTHGPLVLSGGETARAVLGELGIDTLHVRAGWEAGVVAGVAADGRPVVTKPGGFGDPDTLCRVAGRLGVGAGRKENA